MTAHIVIAFVAGAALSALILPGVRRLRARLGRLKASTTYEDNQVTTISQVLHLVVQGSPTAIAVIDHGGDVLLTNNQAHDMAIIHDRTVNPEVWAEAEKVLEDREPRTLELDIPKRRTGNRVTNIRAYIAPLTLVDDRFLVVYGTDESESVRMENARRDFVANVSHELKTPVGGMSLLAEALLDSTDDAEHVDYFATKLLDESHRMGELIAELIDLSKLQGAEALPDMEPVEVDEVVEEALARNQLKAEGSDIELTNAGPSGVKVMGSKSLLVTAVSNLISNAINYSPRSTPVSVSQKIVEDSDSVLIRVTDRGIGIAPEDQERVFERFYRVDKARSRQTGGTGLGLAIVKHVVANHGGTITLWSRVGTGSTFTIELPRYTPGPTAERALAPEAGSSALRTAVTKVTTRRKDKTL